MTKQVLLAEALFNALEGVKEHSDISGCDIELVPHRRYIVELMPEDLSYYNVTIKGTLNLLSVAIFIEKQLEQWAKKK